MTKKTVAILDVELQTLKEQHEKDMQRYIEENTKEHDEIKTDLKGLIKKFDDKFVKNGYDTRIAKMERYVDKQMARDTNRKYFWWGVAKQVLTSVIIGALIYFFWIHTGFQF